MNNLKAIKAKSLKKHYERLFLKYRYNFKTAQQSSKKTQEKRMLILIEKINFDKKSKVLDFGCGTAHLYNLLVKKKKFSGYYTGIDIAENIINSNKKKFYPNKKVKFYCGNILKKNNFELNNYDYIFVSGTFNNKIMNQWKLMKRILKKLFSITKKALIFNNLSTYVDYRDKNLFYINPEKVFKYCKKNLSKFVELRHDYQIKKKIIPFEFTTYVYKKN